jgi:hypothetical protein
MALESKDLPVQASGVGSLSPEDRGTYRRMVWGLCGLYAAAIAFAGVLVVSHGKFQKQDIVVASETLRHQ